MEALLKLLPSRPQPLAVRYGLTAALVLIFFAIRLGAGPTAGPYSFILFVPPIVIAAIVFDRGSAFFAVGLSACLVASIVDWHTNAFSHISAIAIFILVALFVAIVGEGMRSALERQVKSQREAELLFEEQTHRIKNDLAIACSLLALQARAQPSPDVRDALESAVGKLNVLAKSYEYLRMLSAVDETVDMQEYLSDLCWHLGERLRGIRPIAVDVSAANVVAGKRKATRIGLIVNELATNALKHAFPGDRAGSICVKLERGPSRLVLVVQDDGIGCPEDAKDGTGSRLIRLLVQQMRGTMTRGLTEIGCQVTIIFPSERS